MKRNEALKTWPVRYCTLLQTFFIIITTILSGVYASNISNIMSSAGGSFFEAVRAARYSNIILLVYVLVLVFYAKFQRYINTIPDNSIIRNRKEIINNLLESMTEALFYQFEGLQISAVVQTCDEKSKKRRVAYQYKNDRNDLLANELDLDFGDVGRVCIRNRTTLIREYTLANWEQQNERYKEVVPKDLRMIIAKPIFNKKKVIAILEVDIFEHTTEMRQDKSKLGYLTDAILTSQVKETLNDRNVKTILGNWAQSVSLLLDEK